MSLLRKASIVTTPTSYENGKILSVKPVQSLGSELITNGDFATDSDWVKSGGVTISGGQANIVGDGTSFESITQYSIFTIGKKYKVSVDVTINSGLGLKFQDGANNENIGFATTSGTYVFYFTGTSSADFIIGRRTGGTAFNSSVNNVSIKEAIDADFDFTRNSSATRVNSQGLIEDMQILSGDLVSNGNFSQEGSELITNGDFATDSDWFTTTNTTITNNKAEFINAIFNSDFIQQVITAPSGKFYKVQLDVSNLGSGESIKIRFPFQDISINANGTHTIFGEGTANFFRITPASATATFSIDNVSVKEVGQDWTLTTGWSIGDNKAIYDGSGFSSLMQVKPNLIGKKLKLQFDIVDYTSGTIRIFPDNKESGSDIRYSNNGTYFEYYTAAQEPVKFSNTNI